MGEGFGNGFILGRVEKEQKTDTFCCTQGSWSQDRFSDQALEPSVHFREEEWCERLGSRNQVYFTYLSPELDIVMQTNYLCHTICRRMSYQISFCVSVCLHVYLLSVTGWIGCMMTVLGERGSEDDVMKSRPSGICCLGPFDLLFLTELI